MSNERENNNDSKNFSLLNQTKFPIQFIVIGLTIFTLIILKVLITSSGNKRSKSSRNGKGSLRDDEEDGHGAVIITGSIGSGKSKVWSKIVYGRSAETVTSMIENERLIRLSLDAKNNKDQDNDKGNFKDEKQGESLMRREDFEESLIFNIIDVPGHPRLRSRLISKRLSDVENSCVGIVFVIDSKSGLLGKGLKETTESLHILLSYLKLLSIRSRTTTREPRIPSLLIYLNSYSSGSKPSTITDKRSIINRARSMLEKELAKKSSSIKDNEYPSTTLNNFNRNKTILRLDSLEKVPNLNKNSDRNRASSALKLIINKVLKFLKLGGDEGYDYDSFKERKLREELERRGVGLPEEEEELIKSLEEFEELEENEDDDCQSFFEKFEGKVYFNNYQGRRGGEKSKIEWIVSDTSSNDDDDDELLIKWFLKLSS